MNEGRPLNNGKKHNDFALVRKPSSAVEKAAPGAKRILSSMVTETLALALSKQGSPSLSTTVAAKAESFYQQALRFFHGNGVPKDDAAAVLWFRKAADLGHAIAQHHLGHCFEKGRGVIRDTFEAFHWYKKSAEQGEPKGQGSLGMCYIDGKGVEKDCVRGVNLLRQSADQNDPQSLVFLAMLYLGQSDCVRVDYNEAARLAQLAVECGEAEGRTIIGILYANGFGIQRDIGKAIELWQKAAEEGSGVACGLLGQFYVEGIGVAVDFCEAFKWRKLSAERGSKAGTEELATLSSLLTPSDLQEGERRYRKFKARVET